MIPLLPIAIKAAKVTAAVGFKMVKGFKFAGVFGKMFSAGKKIFGIKKAANAALSKGVRKTLKSVTENTNVWFDFEPALIERCANEAMVPALEECAKIVVNEAKASMKHGYGIPSDPGTPPHIQTGRLHKSLKPLIGYARTQKGQMPMAIIEGIWYGSIHEYGNAFSHHPARAFIRPAFESAQKKFPKVFKKINYKGTPTGRRLEGRVRMRRVPPEGRKSVIAGLFGG